MLLGAHESISGGLHEARDFRSFRVVHAQLRRAAQVIVAKYELDALTPMLRLARGKPVVRVGLSMEEKTLLKFLRETIADRRRRPRATRACRSSSRSSIPRTSSRS